MNDTLAAGIHRVGRFLDDHWAFKYYVVPIWLMGTLLFLLVVLNPNATPGEAIQLVALFLAFTLAIAASGVVVELSVRKLGALKTGE